jgi:hypothetical protein
MVCVDGVAWGSAPGRCGLGRIMLMTTDKKGTAWAEVVVLPL